MRVDSNLPRSTLVYFHFLLGCHKDDMRKSRPNTSAWFEDEKNHKCIAINQTPLGMPKDRITHLGRSALSHPVFSHVLYFDAEAATGACPVAKLELKTDEGT